MSEYGGAVHLYSPFFLAQKYCFCKAKESQREPKRKKPSLFEIYKNNEVFCAEAQNGESCKKAPKL